MLTPGCPSQIQLVHVQMKRARINDDADEEQLHADIKALLEEENEGNEDPALLDPIIGRLNLTSLPAAEMEIAALEKESARLCETGASHSSAKELMQAIRLMRKLQLSLGGESSEKKEEEESGTSTAQITALNPPDEFRCPISLELMRDPVLVSTGQVRGDGMGWDGMGGQGGPMELRVVNNSVASFVFRMPVAGCGWVGSPAWDGLL